MLAKIWTPEHVKYLEQLSRVKKIKRAIYVLVQSVNKTDSKELAC